LTAALLIAPFCLGGRSVSAQSGDGSNSTIAVPANAPVSNDALAATGSDDDVAPPAASDDATPAAADDATPAAAVSDHSDADADSPGDSSASPKRDRVGADGSSSGALEYEASDEENGQVLEVPQVIDPSSLAGGSSDGESVDEARDNSQNETDDEAQSEESAQQATEGEGAVPGEVGTIQDYENQTADAPVGAVLYAPGSVAPITPVGPFGMQRAIGGPSIGGMLPASPIIIPPTSAGSLISTSPMLMPPRGGFARPLGGFPRGGFIRGRR
jgi:hypothetical protein